MSSTPGHHRLKGKQVSSVRGACLGNQTRSYRPYRTVTYTSPFPGTSCQATFNQSLRDNAQRIGVAPFARSPTRRTPNAKRQTPLPNQPTKFLLVHDPNAERARPVQLAAGLLARQQEISLAANARGQPAAMAPDQVGKHLARFA